MLDGEDGGDEAAERVPHDKRGLREVEVRQQSGGVGSEGGGRVERGEGRGGRVGGGASVATQVEGEDLEAEGEEEWDLEGPVE